MPASLPSSSASSPALSFSASFPSSFPIAAKWPPQHPERLQLYTLPTPNGVKITILLEECGLPYEVHRVAFDRNDQFSPEFLSLNPNNKIPALIDPDGPGGKPLALWESGAMLVYIAGKTGFGLPADLSARYETLQWVMWQMGGVGPMFGQLDRYVAETKRLLKVLNERLAGRAWIMGDDYSIADIATLPWVRNLVGFYGAGELVGFSDFPEVKRVLDVFVSRPAVQRGLLIPTAPAA